MAKRRLNCYAGNRHARTSVSGGKVPEKFIEDCARLAAEAIGPAKRNKASQASPDSDAATLEFWYGHRDKGGTLVFLEDQPARVTLRRHTLSTGVPLELREKVTAVWAAACRQAGLSAVPAE